MPRYPVLEHYCGGPEPDRAVPPIDLWALEDVEAHMTSLREVSRILQERADRGPEDVDQLVRSPFPKVVAGYFGTGGDLAAAEVAVLDATVESLRLWPEHPPRDSQPCQADPAQQESDRTGRSGRRATSAVARVPRRTRSAAGPRQPGSPHRRWRRAGCWRCCWSSMRARRRGVTRTAGW
jgi:hypothetical protein